MDGTSKVGCAYQLGTGERLDYKRDFSAVLREVGGQTVQTIQSAAWSVEPDDGNIQLVNPWVNDPYVGVYIQGVKAGQYYRVAVTVTTSGTQTYEEVIGIAGIQKTAAA